MTSTISRLRNATKIPVASSGKTRHPLLARGTSPERLMASMGSVGTLFSVVDLLASDTSAVEWKLWRKSASGMTEDREEVTNHAALTVWNRPNDFMTQQEFVEIFQQHVDLVGETEWFVGRDPRAAFPLELWPIRPDRMTPVPHPTKFLTGWLYKDPDGGKIPLELNEVIQIRRPNPLDMYRGLGPVQALLADLDSTKYSAEWNRNFFLNSAEPGGIIEVDKRLSDPEFKELTERWNEQHRGVSRAHRVAVIEQGKWVDRGFSQKDMQFVQLREVSRNTIMEAYRVHKHILGIAEDVNRASAEAAEVVHARRLIVPRLERIKQALNNDFLPMFGSTGQGVEFDYCDPVPEDREVASKERTDSVNNAVALIDSGFDPAETLAAFGLPEITFRGRADAQAPVG